MTAIVSLKAFVDEMDVPGDEYHAHLNCIHGSGAFRRFRSIIHECGIVDEWYRFRQSALEEIAIEWLEANNIQYRKEET